MILVNCADGLGHNKRKSKQLWLQDNSLKIMNNKTHHKTHHTTPNA